MLYCAVLYYKLYYNMYCTVLYCVVQYCIILYCTVLYLTVLYYTVLCTDQEERTVSISMSTPRRSREWGRDPFLREGLNKRK